jgi:RNA polymerase sigma factor (TIGR02999 family)
MGARMNTEFTRLLNEASMHDRPPSEELLTLVYDQLRRVAQQKMAEERAGHTLQATALVHEAWLRLIGDQDVEWRGRAHFFAADAMRKILIDHARRRGAVKRGGGSVRAITDVLDLASDENIDQALALDDALLRLETEDAQAGKVVRLRFFAGLSVDQTAEVLGVSRRTVARNWAYARAWLLEALQEHG